jgi:hypothetical protein
MDVAEALIVYEDLGVSPGMKHEIAAATAAQLPIVYRHLGTW